MLIIACIKDKTNTIKHKQQTHKKGEIKPFKKSEKRAWDRDFMSVNTTFF